MCRCLLIMCRCCTRCTRHSTADHGGSCMDVVLADSVICDVHVNMYIQFRCARSQVLMDAIVIYTRHHKYALKARKWCLRCMDTENHAWLVRFPRHSCDPLTLMCPWACAYSLFAINALHERELSAAQAPERELSAAQAPERELSAAQAPERELSAAQTHLLWCALAVYTHTHTHAVHSPLQRSMVWCLRVKLNYCGTFAPLRTKSNR